MLVNSAWHIFFAVFVTLTVLNTWTFTKLLRNAPTRGYEETRRMQNSLFNGAWKSLQVTDREVKTQRA